MITIAGAGLGGLTLARVLHTRGIPSVVWEAEPAPDTPRPGGMLRLHAESGQAAMRLAGLFTEFRSISRAEGDAVRILDKTGAVRRSDEGLGDRAEVDRGVLRDLLLNALPPGTVRWGARITEVRPDRSVTFAGGRVERAEVLVGADGVWSKVRTVVSAAVPAYSGLSFVEIWIAHRPDLAALVGPGLMVALSDEKGLIAHHRPGDELCVYVALKTPPDLTGITREELLGHFADWHERLRALITGTEAELVVRPIHVLPAGHHWDRPPGMTLIGDAAHLMSPFAGAGANLAMLDGAELATAIADRPGDVEGALDAYENAMFPRSEAAAAESAVNLIACFEPESPEALLDLVERHESLAPSE